MTDKDIRDLAAQFFGRPVSEHIAFARALESRVLAERKEPRKGEWVEIEAKGLKELCAALERAESKGYLPDAICDEWQAFDFNYLAHPTPDDADELRGLLVECREHLDRLTQGGIRDRITARIDAIDRARQSGEEGK
jgi:hypothetical protein